MNSISLRVFAVVISGIVSGHAAQASEGVIGQHGMVVTEQALASEVGAAILKRGGNAVDAAVAVGYAEAVVYPCCGNLGGGGFMTIRFRL